MRRERNESFVCPYFQYVLANVVLLLVGASPPRIENILFNTKLEFNNSVFKLAATMAFDTICVVPGRRQQAL